MSDDPRVMAVHLERGRHVRVDRDGSPRCACGWSWPDGRADDFERHVAAVAVAALDAHDREHRPEVSEIGLESWANLLRVIDNRDAELRQRIAQEIEAAHRTAPDCCAYELAARIARGQA